MYNIERVSEEVSRANGLLKIVSVIICTSKLFTVYLMFAPITNRIVQRFSVSDTLDNTF